MSGDSANDVQKALAAFGAPSLKYHSFGPSQVKPSSMVVPRRDVVAPLQPMAPVAPPVVRQSEPDAAPEPMRAMPPLVPRPSPMSNLASPMPPVPAFRRAIDPAAGLSRPAPDAAATAIDRPCRRPGAGQPGLRAARAQPECAAARHRLHSNGDAGRTGGSGARARRAIQRTPRHAYPDRDRYDAANGANGTAGNDRNRGAIVTTRIKKSKSSRDFCVTGLCALTRG